MLPKFILLNFALSGKHFLPLLLFKYHFFNWKTHDFIQSKVLYKKVGLCHLCLWHIHKIALLKNFGQITNGGLKAFPVRSKVSEVSNLKFLLIWYFR